MLNLSNYNLNPDEIKLIKDFKLITSQEIKSNAFIYIAGYVARKFRNQFQNLGFPTKSPIHLMTGPTNYQQTIACIHLRNF